MKKPNLYSCHAASALAENNRIFNLTTCHEYKLGLRVREAEPQVFACNVPTEGKTTVCLQERPPQVLFGEALLYLELV